MVRHISHRIIAFALVIYLIVPLHIISIVKAEDTEISPTAAETIQSDPSPTPSESSEPTPSPTISEPYQSENPETVPIASPSPMLINEILPVATNEASIGEPVTQQYPQPVQEDKIPSSSLEITQSSVISNNKTVSIEIHGGNTASAEAAASIIQNINFNTVGNDIDSLIIDILEPKNGNINLSDLRLAENSGRTCKPFAENLWLPFSSININDNVELSNSINITVNTGSNVLPENSFSDETGSGSVYAYISTIANTNLIGNCGLFNITNLFSSLNGDIILPYELDYLQPEKDNLLIPSVLGISVTNTNQALIDTDINTEGNTGSNNTTLLSGDSKNNITVLNQANTNIVSNKWFLLTINDYGSWNGDLLNWFGNVEHSPRTYTAFFQSGTGKSIPLSNTTEINTNNTAEIKNNLKLSVNTGNNLSSTDPELRTGNSSIVADIFNMLNTNIIGNNWYYSIINIFDDFNGNIVLARPDLAIILSADRSNAYPGETITYRISYANVGTHMANNVILTATVRNNILPPLSWPVGTVLPDEKGEIEYTVTLPSQNNYLSSITYTVTITTTTDEPDKTDNSDSITTAINQYINKTSLNTDSNNDKQMYEINQTDKPLYALPITVKTIRNVPPTYVLEYNAQKNILGSTDSSPKKKSGHVCQDIFTCTPLGIVLILMVLYHSAGLLVLKKYEN